MNAKHGHLRAFAGFLMFALLLALSACSEEAYSVTKQVYTQAPNEKSSIRIEYPSFSGEGSEALNTLVLKKIQKFAIRDTSLFGTDAGLSVDYKSEITLLSSKMVSIVFWGSSYIEGAIHPLTDLISLNIDLRSMQELSFTDLYTVDSEFEKVFFSEAYFPTAPLTSYDAESFPEMLRLQSPENGGLSPFDYPEYISCFLKPEGIVLSMSAVHATGSDHFEAQLDYGKIQKFYKPDVNYWED